jgi:hypothetical protein
MLFLVYEDDVAGSLLYYLVPEQSQYIALAYTALPRQDYDSILTKVTLNLIQIVLS